MLVQDIMYGPVVTVAPGDTLADAYRIMHERDIRHLPVVETGRLVGIVTDRDLRFATSALHPAPFPPEARVADVMMRAPKTATPDDPVEEAALKMRTYRIGCLPVVESGRLVGIVTVTDLLDAFVRMTGVEVPGSRLVVQLDEERDRLTALVARIAARGVNLHAVLTYPANKHHTEVVLRVDAPAAEPLADALRREGYTVRRPHT
ncbi:CBS domain-containing protein [Rhodocaloribacter litoris]|uniref:CBS domain-containing protein n=1 Tax=Rhodocaloribacter litoris TaxID=2558931 RepID=UPI00141F91BF|nr:CBS domain-containing protein [Rhodocaloribacter litoris]QXD15461.1 CBS domain-containing protein [Rhodocaloribacter litoris]